MSSSSLSNLSEPDTHTPSASALDKSSPVGKIQRYFAPHKRDQVQAFDESVQQLVFLAPEQFLDCLSVDEPLPSKIPGQRRHLFSIDGLCSLANGIAHSMKDKCEHRLLCIYLFLTIHDYH